MLLIKKIIYFSPNATGGLAEYAHEQACAISRLGVEVTMLAPRGFKAGLKKDYLFRTLPDSRTYPMGKKSIFPRIMGKILRLQNLLDQHRFLLKTISQEHFDCVLFGAFAEYFAPLWSRSLCRLSHRGVIFGAVIHDPVRDFILGPLWWHRLSIASAYGFLREAFVHEEVTLDTIRPISFLRTTVIPHGIYRFPEPNETREESRRSLGLPRDARVALSFGHIRDGKNLDLVIRSMLDIPEMYLVVAGKEQSSAQKPISYYQKLALELGVSARCRWLHEYVHAGRVGALFIASDVILLTYSKNFRSASGVLNAALQYRKPFLASGGKGNLLTVVDKYQLGKIVEPDNLEALAVGLRMVFNEPINSRWNDYENENSWEKNAKIVIQRLSTP